MTAHVREVSEEEHLVQLRGAAGSVGPKAVAPDGAEGYHSVRFEIDA